MLDGVERKTNSPQRVKRTHKKSCVAERKLLRKQAAEEEENIAAAEAAYKESISNSAILDYSELSNLDLPTAVEKVEDPPSAQSHEADNENMDFETDTKNSLVNEILNSKSKISRHQRKVMRGERLKKETSSNNRANNDQAERESRSGSSKKMELVKSKAQKEKAKPMPRGKKGKLKKIKKKYKDQDEEETRIRMKALGNPMPEPVVKVDEEAKDTGAAPTEGDGPNVPKGRAIKNLPKRSDPKVDNDTPIETPEEQLTH